MRIIHAHKYFHSRDGASRYERGLMRLQEEAGHTVAPFAMHDPRNEPTPWSGYFVSHEDTRRVSFGLRAFRHASRALWSLEAKRKFEALVDVFRPDVIHVHNIYTQISPSILAVAKRRNIPVVMTVHDYALVSANYSLWNGSRSMDLEHLGVIATTKTKYIKGSFLATFMLEMILKVHRAVRAYDGAIQEYIAFSGFMRDRLIHAGFAKEKIAVMHPFAEPLMHRVHRNVQRPTHNGRYILFAGRLESYKGAQVLIDALKYAPKDISIAIAGVGPDEERLKTLVRQDPRVKFLGFVPGEQLWGMMRGAVAVVVPSVWHEPYGLVALEAMSMGAPVIVAKSGGLPEVVGEKGTGIVVPAGDAKALGRAMSRLWGDDGLARNMGEAAGERAREIGDPAKHLACVFEVYAKAIEQME